MVEEGLTVRLVLLRLGVHFLTNQFLGRVGVRGCVVSVEKNWSSPLVISPIVWNIERWFVSLIEEWKPS